MIAKGTRVRLTQQYLDTCTTQKLRLSTKRGTVVGGRTIAMVKWDTSSKPNAVAWEFLELDV
jgi:hypothetical protein